MGTLGLKTLSGGDICLESRPSSGDTLGLKTLSGKDSLLESCISDGDM